MIVMMIPRKRRIKDRSRRIVFKEVDVGLFILDKG